MNSTPYLFLDFDGVICDSLDECIISSLYAYFRLYRKKETEPVSLAVDFKKRFNNLRPYVRHGEDYLVIQQILEQGQGVANQGEFDTIIEKHRDKMGLYKELFYKARNFFLGNHAAFWYHLNTLFPPMTRYLESACTSPYVYILSTKRGDFIRAILEDHRIQMPEERILVAWGVKKLDFISSILDKEGGEQAYFIDDQVHHLLHNTDQRIIPCLAAWGYIQEEWLTAGVRVMEEDEMSTILKSYT
jgi:hypothetical protein